MSDDKLLLEELSKSDIEEIKALIRVSLIKLFYTLYVKKNTWT